jgi:hypothetical protein
MNATPQAALTIRANSLCCSCDLYLVNPRRNRRGRKIEERFK